MRFDLKFISLRSFINHKNNKKPKVSNMRTFSPFELLTDDADELSTMELKANMMIAIRDLIELNKWTQADAAAMLGVSQPRISNLANGKIDKFSIDVLIGMLTKLGFRFQFDYSKSAVDRPQVSMTVRAAS